MEFRQMTVQELKCYLQERGVTCHLSRKDHLIKLSQLAEEMKLEILSKTEQEMTEDYEILNKKRREVTTEEGNCVMVDDVTKIQGWSKNLMTLPNLESANIIVYLFNECGWGEERLKDYKYDNGYQLFKANHIDGVEVCCIEELPYVYVRASCVPETRQNDQPYTTWTLLHLSGRIQSAGCTCVADDGSCKHCVALLFSIENFLDRHKDRYSQACTDVECVWDKPRRKSLPMPITDININRDPLAQANLVPTPVHYDPRGKQSEEGMDTRAIEKQFYNLFRGENSLILQTIDPPTDDSSDEDVGKVPTMIEAMKGFKQGEQVENYLKSIFREQVISDVELATRGQCENDNWFAHRQGRLTASLFPSIMNFRFNDKPDNYIVKKVMNLGSEVRSLSIKFGKDHEPIARNLYFRKLRMEHRSLVVKQCGLFLDKAYPYMGASPDGIVTCKCCGKGLIEIKCSYTYQNEDPMQACFDNNYHVYSDENNTLRLKCSSPWYIQIQGQMGVCGLNWCDFIFYTKKGISVDRVEFDPEIYKEITAKCKKFFEKYVLRVLKQY